MKRMEKWKATMHRRTPKIDGSNLWATCAYLDLNPVAAGLAPTPKASAHTSFKVAPFKIL